MTEGTPERYTDMETTYERKPRKEFINPAYLLTEGLRVSWPGSMDTINRPND